MINEINNKTFCQMLISAANNLCNHRQEVDSMNVFPVPDGDTGSNMSMTITSCVKNISDLTDKSIEEISKAVANSALRGARGNSGVILSQLIRGMQKALIGVDNVDTQVLALCFENASKSAYRAVMKPTEGTILTVARMMAEKAVEKKDNFDDVLSLMEVIVDEGNHALSLTPKLLPQLKQAGVVDSGGQGLMYLVEGALYYLKNGKIIEATNIEDEGTKIEPTETLEDIKFSYCTECIIEKKNKKVNSFKFKTTIEMLGDSMVIVDDEEIIKVHIHTNEPNIVLGEALKLGELSSVKIENMRIQHSNLVKEEKEKSDQSEIKEKSDAFQNNNVIETQSTPPKKYAFAAVGAGDGIVSTLKDLGIDYVIEGGQTMNPSTDDILNAVESLNAENVIIFPNNKNIIMAAEQARDICDCNVIVIPTKSVTESISCMLVYDEDMEAIELEKEFNDVRNRVVSAQITYAVRDTNVDGMEILCGDILGIVDGKIKHVNKSTSDSAMEIFRSEINEDTSIVMLFYGNDTTEEQAQKLASDAESEFPDVDFTVAYGGQPVYDYFISIE